MVGAIVTDASGAVVGRGFHRARGEAHAEAVALREAGEQARGGTLYVTLEPCAHHGRTPPCVDAVLASGVKRVVATHVDPDPRTAGQSFRRLRESGVGGRVGRARSRGGRAQPALRDLEATGATRGHAQVGDEPRRQDRHRRGRESLDLVAGRSPLGARPARGARRLAGRKRHRARRRSVARPSRGVGARRPTRAWCSIAGCASVQARGCSRVRGPC